MSCVECFGSAAPHPPTYPAETKPHTCVFFQDRPRMYDSLNMHSLESSLIDIMRAEQDPMKSKAPFFCDRPRVGAGVGGGERSCSPKRPEWFGGGRRQAPAAPRAVLFFHTPAYFLPCLELNTFATSCTQTRPSSSWSCCYLTWAEPTRGDTMVLLTSLLRSAFLISCRCEQEHK